MVLPLAAATVAVGAVAAVAIASGVIDPPSSSPPATRPVAQTIDTRLSSALHVFKRAANSGDALPVGTRKRLAAGSVLGTNVALARRARKGPDGQDYYLVAGQGSIALVNQDGSGSIDDIDHALSGKSVSFEDCATGGTQVRVIGLLPTTASNAIVTLVDGTQRAVDTVNNVYIVLLDRTPQTMPKTLEFDLGGVHQIVSIPAPSDIGSTSCGPPAGMKPPSSG